MALERAGSRRKCLALKIPPGTKNPPKNPCEEGGAGGGADWAVGDGVGEMDALFAKAIEVGRLDLGVAGTAKVHAAPLVGHDDEDVWFGLASFLRGFGEREGCEEFAAEHLLHRKLRRKVIHCGSWRTAQFESWLPTESRVRRPLILSRSGWLMIAGLLVLLAAAVYIAYWRDMRVRQKILIGESRIHRTRHGPVEFATWGGGPAVLVLHGAGGGYDQGVSIGRAFGGEGFLGIAPSRFGYLRSPLPADASTPAQADALADLLDGLGIDRVAILAMSGGVPPALQFVLRHPTRTRSIVLLSSAPYTPLTAAQQKLPIPIWVYQGIFLSDFPYWLLTKLARSSMENIFDVKPKLRATLTLEERAFVARTVDAFAPVTQRREGLQNEGAAIDPRTSYPLERLRVPTLVIHARDDGINPFAFGEYTAQHFPDAQLLALPTGGHLLLGHQVEVQARVQAFWRESGREGE